MSETYKIGVLGRRPARAVPFIGLRLWVIGRGCASWGNLGGYQVSSQSGNINNGDPCDPPCDEDENYLRQQLSMTGLTIGFNRAYYQYRLDLILAKYTLPSGIIDYEGGAAARTATKQWLRGSFTSYPIAKFLDWKFPAVNPYPSNPTPSFWKDNKLVSLGTNTAGLLGALGMGYEGFGLINNYYNVSPNSYKTSLGRFSWNGTKIGLATYGGFPGFVASMTMGSAQMYHDRPRTAWDGLRLSSMPVFFTLFR